MKLTLPQQDVYFEQLLYANDPIYNIGAKIRIEGNVVYEILNEAYIVLINQHDAYRSIVHQKEAIAEIELLSTHDSTLGFADFSAEKQAEEKAEIFMQETFQQAFDFSKKELLHKFILVKVQDKLFYLFSMYHHIITDGWGTSLMFQRLVQNYNELITYGKIKSEYPFSYIDFIEDDEKYANSEDFQKDKIYWTQKFKNLPERVFEKLDETVHVNKSKRKELIIKRAVYNELEVIAKTARCSTFHLILGLLYLYFGRKHQNKDFAIGLPVLNRGKSVFKKTVGLFMGVSALRMELDFEQTFEELISAIRQQLRQDYRHQRFPLGKLIQELDIFQEKDRLFNITLSYEKQNYADHFKNTQTSVIPMTHESERVALAVYIREFDALEDVKIDLDYNINYFTEATISQVATHLEQLIEKVRVSSDEKLKNYAYLTTAEEAQVRYEFNTTTVDYPKTETLVNFFEKQVLNRGDHIAVTDGFINYTYKELDVLSNNIAHYIRKNVQQGEENIPIAVLMPRSVNLLVTLLGILKSGNAYIPLDPEFPQERLEYIVAHSGVQCIIGTENLQNSIQTTASFVNFKTISGFSEQIALPKIKASQTAYIIYTSGSTGNPKGVSIGHQALLNFLLSIQKEPNITENDVLFSVTTQSFDISILEFFTPLISGATVYVATKELLSNPLDLLDTLLEVKPTVMQATPSFYQLLFNAGWTGDRNLKILCGGDLLSKALAKKLVENCGEVWNMYGPTETTIWSSTKKIEHYTEASTIGKPIANTQLYILDENLQLVPVGSVGAIYIGGDGLAQGYYKNQVLTDEKFIKSPFDPSKKIYETGDLGKWNEAGEIEFLGRNDYQVKIRGYRIELGEIETKLNQISTIKEAVVVAKKRADQEALLVAYIIPSSEDIDTTAIIRNLRSELPEYMIPYTIVSIESFPLTPNKKVDRKALTLREIQHSITDEIAQVAETQLEKSIATYFTDVLGMQEVLNINDNFFSLGGHSLNAVKLINRIEKELHRKVSLKTIFDYPTIATLAGFLERTESQNLPVLEKVEHKPYYAITSAQYALWLASQKEEKSIAYNMPAVYTISGTIDLQVFEKAFNKLIEKHEIIRSNFVEIDGIPQQKIADTSQIQFTIDQLQHGDEVVSNYIHKVFDLEEDILLRVAYIASEQTLLFVTHHIIMDGWSLEILINEVVTNYKHLLEEKAIEESILEFQFKDYVVWENKIAFGQLAKNTFFWKKYLEGYQWKSLLPMNENLAEANDAAEFYSIWDKELLHSIRAISQEKNCTLHTFLIAGFNMLMHKMYGINDLCVGTVNSGRNIAELQEHIGMFVKTLPLRTQLSAAQNITEILSKTHQNLLEIDQYQNIPQELQHTIRLDVLIALQTPSFNYNTIEVTADTTLQLQSVASRYSRLPLLINFIESENQLQAIVTYNSALYDQEAIEILFLKYEQLIKHIVENPNTSLAEISIELGFEQKETIDIDFNF